MSNKKEIVKGVEILKVEQDKCILDVYSSVNEIIKRMPMLYPPDTKIEITSEGVKIFKLDEFISIENIKEKLIEMNTKHEVLYNDDGFYFAIKANEEGFEIIYPDNTADIRKEHNTIEKNFQNAIDYLMFIKKTGPLYINENNEKIDPDENSDYSNITIENLKNILPGISSIVLTNTKKEEIGKYHIIDDWLELAKYSNKKITYIEPVNASTFLVSINVPYDKAKESDD